MSKVIMWLSGTGFLINLVNTILSINDDRYDKVWFYFFLTILCGSVFMYLREEGKNYER